MNKPAPNQIKAVREAARLSQSEAAALVYSTRRTWQNWEAPEGSANHRAMPLNTWESFEVKARRAAEVFDLVLTPAAILEAAERLGIDF